MTDDCQTRSSPQPEGRDRLINQGEDGADCLQQVCSSRLEGGEAPENNLKTKSDEVKHTSALFDTQSKKLSEDSLFLK